MKKLIHENIKHLVVHCSLTTPSMNIGVDHIRNWHKARGFEDVGYHFVIQRDGSLQIGRPLLYEGAHVLGHNDTSIGICLIGGLEENAKASNPPAVFNYTFNQMQTLVKQLHVLKVQFAKAEPCGHRDLDNQRTCPGFDVAEFMKYSVGV